MIRLLTWLITGFWPSRASMHALRRDLDALQRAHESLKKRFNTLAGSYYQETSSVSEAPGAISADVGSAPTLEREPDDFPEEEFQQLIAQRRLQHG